MNRTLLQVKMNSPKATQTMNRTWRIICVESVKNNKRSAGENSNLFLSNHAPLGGKKHRRAAGKFFENFSHFQSCQTGQLVARRVHLCYLSVNFSIFFSRDQLALNFISFNFRQIKVSSKKNEWNSLEWKLPVRTVSNALKVKVVLGREGPVRVGRLRGGCESSSAAAVRPGVPFYRIPSLVASSASLPLLFNFLFLLSVVSSCATFCSFFSNSLGSHWSAPIC